MAIFDSELRMLEVLWREGPTPAKQIARVLGDGEPAWNVNTTYTVIARCVRKGLIERREPGYICRALVSREETRAAATIDLVNRMYGGSVEELSKSLASYQSEGLR